ncbi:hypothetical protein J2Z65_000374 [Paenibacillus aceris]|uniref:Uncharacterized protein n=1 Tax=Paenibacillus aceris TaxID=869555 RepID=A0ABS4HRD9_9BACL|nr:hypothetical protein [Paenibacillus aceris]
MKLKDLAAELGLGFLYLNILFIRLKMTKAFLGFLTPHSGKAF